MTVSSQVSSVSYLGDGVTTLLPVPYYFLEQTHLLVTRVNADTSTTTLVLGSDYSVSGAGNQAGGSITMFVAPVVGSQIIIDRSVPATQETDYVANDPFPAESHERALDKLTMLVQQNAAGLSRALLRPLGKNYYDAQGRQIKNLADPTDDQDAATLRWATDFIASILATGQGPINNAANVIFAGANGFIGVVQDLANKLDPLKGSRMLGHDGWTVGDHLAAMKFPGQFASLKDWAASGGNLGIAGGTYTVTEQLTFPHGTVVHTFGRVTIDASAVTTLTNFPDFAAVLAGGLSLTALPKLTAAAIGALTLNFASAHGLSAGDLFCIYDPTPGSYGPGHRPEYHAGEYCRVARVTSPTQVVLDSPLYATYVAASMDYYKLGAGSFHICGDLVVKGSLTLNTLRAFRGTQLLDADLTGLTAISPIGPSAVELRQCYNVTGDIVAMQLALSGLGVDYGLSLVGCQDINLSGYFVGSRHGVTTGSYGLAGDVVNRNIQLEGTAKTTFQGGVAALNLHGNTEYFSFDGMSYGGIEVAGNFNKFRGTAFQASVGYCVTFVELSGHDHDLSSMTLRSLSNPGTAQGVIDLGGNTIPALAGTLGGTINLRGVTLIAPNAQRGIMCRQRLSTATDINIDVRDVNIQKLAAGAVSLFVDKVTGNDYATLLRDGFVDNTGGIQSVANVGEVKGARAAGKVTINTSTGAAVATLAVTYPAGVFGGIAPNISCSISTSSMGVKGLVYSAESQTATGFTATIKTADGTNFPSAVAITFGWSAESIN